jgi:lipopolysaccharide transport protein LptA
MAASRVELLRFLFLALLLGVGIRTSVAAEAEECPESVIKYYSRAFKLSTGTYTLQLIDEVLFCQGAGMSIRADQATARGKDRNVDDSQWEFRGNVRIEYQGAQLNADTATVTFANKQLGQATVVGQPATFAHQAKGSSQRNQGRARSIEFNAAKGTLRLSGGAWFSDGRNEVSTAAVVYNLADRSAASEPGSGDNRVRTTIRPEAKNPATIK